MSTNPLNDISKVYLEQVVSPKVEEGYQPIGKEQENRMYRRAGNLARTSLSSTGNQKLTAATKSARIVSAITRQKERERFDRIGQDPTHNEEAKKPNDGNLANNYPPYDKVTRGDVIAGRLGKDEMGGKKKNKNVREGFSNWREDLSEVMSSVEKEDGDVKITEKKVQNKVKTSAMGGGINLPEAVQGIGGTLVEMVEIGEEFIYESVNIAAQYFCEQGLNEYGIDILIEELGLEDFAAFVFELAEDYTIIEARAGGVRVEPVTAKGQKFKSGKPTGKSLARLRAQKAARREAEAKASAAKPSGMKAALQRQSAVASAKKQQPKKKGVLDRVAGAVLKGMERHQQATSAARQAFQTGMQRHRAATSTASNLAKETGKTAVKAGKVAGHFAKSAASGASQTAKGIKKAVVGEETELQEKITAKTDMGMAIKDFYASKSPQLAGRTKEERRKAAIAAVLTARRGGKKLGEQAMEMQPKTQPEKPQKPQNTAAINQVLLAKQQADTAQKNLAARQRMAAQKGVNLSSLTSGYEPEGEVIGEEDYDTMKDRHLERGGMGARSSTSPAKTSTAKPQTDAERKASMAKQRENARKALELVRQQTLSKYGKGSLM